MLDEEKNDISMLNTETKKEIAETTQLSLADVQDVIQKH
jgi:signal recognition particle GTPase